MLCYRISFIGRFRNRPRKLIGAKGGGLIREFVVKIVIEIVISVILSSGLHHSMIRAAVYCQESSKRFKVKTSIKNNSNQTGCTKEVVLRNEPNRIQVRLPSKKL